MRGEWVGGWVSTARCTFRHSTATDNGGVQFRRIRVLIPSLLELLDYVLYVADDRE